MEKPISKEEVLKRKELRLGEDDCIAAMNMQGVWGENIVWHGGESYIPVIYRGQKWKYQVHIKPRDIE